MNDQRVLYAPPRPSSSAALCFPPQLPSPARVQNQRIAGPSLHTRGSWSREVSGIVLARDESELSAPSPPEAWDEEGVGPGAPLDLCVGSRGARADLSRRGHVLAAFVLGNIARVVGGQLVRLSRPQNWRSSMVVPGGRFDPPLVAGIAVHPPSLGSTVVGWPGGARNHLRMELRSGRLSRGQKSRESIRPLAKLSNRRACLQARGSRSRERETGRLRLAKLSNRRALPPSERKPFK